MIALREVLADGHQGDDPFVVEQTETIRVLKLEVLPDGGTRYVVEIWVPVDIGVQIFAPSSFTNTFTGIVLNHDGSEYHGTITTPPLYSGPNGIYLLSDKAPVTDTGTDIFLNILGRLPNVGEQVTQLNGTSTYLGNGNWDSVPTLNYGNSAFLNIQSVPEPSVLVFSLAGFAMLAFGRRFYL